jgi:quercetin dioxygenase-like cupin family protein
MSTGRFDAIAADEPWPGVRRRAFDSEGATVTRYEFEPGAVFPTHNHPQEQITLIDAGQVEFTVDGRTERLGPGEWSVVAPNVAHGLRAGPAGARFLAIIVPRRESGDAYTVMKRGPR